MKKLSCYDLAGLFSVLNTEELMSFVGGGDGTTSNPFTEYEAKRMIECGVFNGGYVKDDSGDLSYWLPEVVVWGGCGSGYGYDDYGYYNPWDSYYYDSSYNPWGDDGYGNNYYSPSLPNCPDWVSNATDIAGGIGDIISNSNMSYGSNGKLYYITRNGGLFYGNQYVTTTSLSTLGKSLGILGYASFGIAVYNVASDCYNGDYNAATQEAATAAGSLAGGWAGAKVGSLVGTAICPGIGTAIGGVIGGLIGGWGGSYIVEISFFN